MKNQKCREQEYLIKHPGLSKHFMATWRTPQMVHAVGGITDEMVDAFKQYIAGVQPVASVGGSNGAANTLTNWDGTEVANGWRAPTRPNFLNYSKKKGGGLSR